MFRKKDERQQDLDTARKALKSKDYKHAIHHVSMVLANNAGDKDAQLLLEQIVTASGCSLDLVPLENRMHFGILASRAYILSRRDEWDEALLLLSQVIEAAPTFSYLPWLTDWMARAPKVSLPVALKVLAMLVKKTLDPASQPYFERLTAIYGNLRQLYPDDSLLASMSSVLLRKLGRFDEAIAIASRDYEAHPGKQVGVILGTHYREKGDLKTAVEIFKQALALTDPQSDLDDYIRLDIGDLYMGLEQLEPALDYYRQVLSHNPSEPHAYSFSLYIQYLLSGNTQFKDELVRHADTHPGNKTAADLVNQLNKEYPYLNYLFYDRDATINMVTQIKLQPGQPNEKIDLNIQISSLESPSAGIAARAYLQRIFKTVNIQFEVGRLQRPDPRLPRKSVDYVLWDYDGTNPKPGIVPPKSVVVSVVSELARKPFNLPGWKHHARKLAAQLGPDAVVDLLGVMVHPPLAPEQVEPWDWMYHIQTAVALILAYIDTAPWAESLRRRALLSLAYGPLDWTNQAAIIALTEVALEDPASRPEICDVFRELLHFPDEGACPYLYALLICPQRLPFLPLDIKNRLQSEIQSRL